MRQRVAAESQLCEANCLNQICALKLDTGDVNPEFFEGRNG
jgi:hypothetical protein